jgi:hypothetical protein
VTADEREFGLDLVQSGAWSQTAYDLNETRFAIL